MSDWFARKDLSIGENWRRRVESDRHEFYVPVRVDWDEVEKLLEVKNEKKK